jgi:uncharacterized protein (DUF2235 family)
MFMPGGDMSEEKPLVRQLIVCCDGTNNTLTGRTHDTNVLRLIDLLDPECRDQLLYYDPGVGAPDQLPPTGLHDWFSRKWDRLQGLASGKGVYENISSAYQFLVEHYQAGDQIFLFGFSRGAFTVRCVSGMVNMFGIVRRENVALLPTLINVYFAKRAGPPQRRDAKRSRNQVADQIKEQFTNLGGRDALIHFIGVWDTVASVGLPLLLETRITSDGYTRQKNFRHIRQALSLDEHRATFQPRLYWDGNYELPQGRSLQQRWFRGVHCDVGGGYFRDEAQLSDQAFDWMVQEAVRLDLRIVNPPPAGKRVAPSAEPEPMPTQMPVVHDECYANPYWGIAGLVARDYRYRLPQKALTQATPEPAGAASSGQPVVSVWSRGLPWKRVFQILVLMLIPAALAGLLGWKAVHGRADWQGPIIGQVLQGAKDFDAWQRSWAFISFANMREPYLPDGFWPALALQAILTDFVLIALYGWILGLFSSWAFARLTGLRDADEPAHPVLLLGWAPCLAIAADITENLATLLVVWLSSYGVPVLPWLAAFVMALANLTKWAALGLSLLMILIAVFAKNKIPVFFRADRLKKSL